MGRESTDERNKRELAELTPAMQVTVKKVLKEVSNNYPHYNWTITTGLRSPEIQDELYQKGRRGVEGERIVTNARGGQSKHQSGRAVDIYPLLPDGRGIPPYEGEHKRAYDYYGRLAETLGLVWGGASGWGGPGGDFGHIHMSNEESFIAEAMQLMKEKEKRGQAMQSVGFGDAFKKARGAGESEFKWRGGRYNTRMKGE